ncbi:hypothetical protein CDD82_4512 [Ophiocordyceps australis]|uniref:BZIP domain-containing protein n=1 Tax=Ophiocordyceps australis TaxID=1399860 RepID=A0A2C5Z2N2_9HYPO|nr:hypothetical protein CDD82_4512 [Ophiocordyceps australis]
MSAAPQNVDLDALLDLSEYDNNYHSPSLSPTHASKPIFASPVTAAVATPSLPSSASQTLSGPSHNYDLYRQQTGFVPGAIANTMAVNQTNNTGYQDFSSLDYLPSLSQDNDMFDFNTSPSQGTVDMDLESPPASQPQFFNTVNPSSIEQESTGPLASPAVSSSSSSVGRLWPGAHSQAALAKAQAKAQAQQRQQQHLIQQQQAQRQGPQHPKARAKAPQHSDPLVEQKITQLLNSMRASSGSDSQSQAVLTNLPRAKKDEEDMDEDERLLASEEGKKLSSKERRQLRNKVSARAFRSRRKEYISQLEAEIATKVTENGALRSQNRALLEENKRLNDFSRMLLSSPSFSNFLDHLSTNPATAAPSQVKVEPQQQAAAQNQVRKDVNPYGNQAQQQQQIGMAMIPENSVDFSLLSLDNNSYNFRPQVFVVDTPDVPVGLDTSVLSGKTSSIFEEPLESNDGKMEVTAPEWAVASAHAIEQADDTTVEEGFESDPEFALFHPQSAVSPPEPRNIDPDGFNMEIFGGLEADKVFARYDLIDATEEEKSSTLAMARLQRISASIAPLVSRLELLTMDL